MNDTNNTHHDHTNEPSGGDASGGDAQLTAYALGELDPQSDDYKAIAAKVADDPALREQVEQIAQLGSQLTQSYDQANGPGLDDATLHNIVDASTAPIARIRPKASLTRRLLPYAGVAACAALMTAGVFITLNPNSPPTQAGRDDAPVIDTVVPDDGTTDEPTQPIEPVEPTTKDRFEQLVTLQQDNLSLKEVIDHLSEQTDSNIIINWPALELVGIDHDSLVSLNLKNLPAHQVLRLALDQVSADAFDDDKAGLRISEDFIQISTLRDLKSDTETRVYNVRDLLVAGDVLSQVKHKLLARVGNSGGGGGQGGLFGDDGGGGLFADDNYEPAPRGRITGQTTNTAPGGTPGNVVYDTPGANKGVPDFSQAPGFDLSGGLSNTSSGGSGGGASLFGDSDDDYEEDLPSREERIDQVVELINTAVGDPDEWLDEESTLTEINGNLVIKTTPENHEQVDQLLAQLRGAGVGEPGQREVVEDIDNVVNMMIRDIEQGLIDVEERRVQRELERERRERFADLTDNPFKLTEQEPLSTFSIDVDTTSYTYGRRTILKDLNLPEPDAVRIEEWVNYFDYGYTAPVINHKAIPNGRLTTAALEKIEAADESFVPFATDVEVVQCPWTEGNQLVRIGIQAMEVSQDDRPPAHLVFLLDVSGSMSSADKLGLVQQGMPLLLEQLNDTDKVSIVVYAGASGLVLEAAEAADKNKIKDAIESLKAGGSTAGGEGIKLAYEIAQKHFVAGGVNRIILCTDGDFNVGTSDTDELVELVKAKANPPGNGNEAGQVKGVYLSVMGFGTGNLNDEMMEKITNAGNGNYHYIDSVKEAVNTLSNQAGGTLVTVAKDVKLQLEFNPAKVASYRLIGYENRILRDEDFNNDTVDAGDIGAGHSVTALYEIVPVKEDADDAKDTEPIIDDLRYQKPRGLAAAAELPELLTLKLRYKPVDAAAEQGTSRKVVTHVPANAVAFDKASEATRFSSSVAALGMILRGSPHKGTATTQWIVNTATNASEHDPNDYRQEFVALATQVGLLQVQDGQNLEGIQVD